MISFTCPAGRQKNVDKYANLETAAKVDNLKIKKSFDQTFIGLSERLSFFSQSSLVQALKALY